MAGRLLCDTYLAARELVREVDYTLSTLARNLLKQERAELAAADVPGGLVDVMCCNPWHVAAQMQTWWMPLSRLHLISKSQRRRGVQTSHRGSTTPA